MITPKFNYESLNRKHINGKRHYEVTSGNYHPMPSVTTVLSATKPPADAQMLTDWRNRVGNIRATYISKEASSRGTRMHAYLETYCNTDIFPIPGSNKYAKQANKMAKQIVDNGLINVSEIWGMELPLYYPVFYGGTADMAMVWKNKEAIGDFKQTNKPKKPEWITDYFIQLALYGMAHNKLHGTNINTGVIFMCSAAYEYQEFVLEGKHWKKYEDMAWKRLEQYYEQLKNEISLYLPNKKS